jgi:hypothetical protein
MMYRIRRKVDGLFSTGGGYPRWTKKGKVWNSIGSLKAHLHLQNYGKSDNYEVVELEMVEKSVQTLSSLCEEVFAAQLKRDSERQAREFEHQRQYELKMLKNLAEKHNKTVI